MKTDQAVPTIKHAESVADFDVARALFREYAEWLEVDLCFQGFEAELRSLETMYAPPKGRLLLATAGADVAGCVAVREKSTAGPGVCEMKRLYVRDAWRGGGLGRRLAEAILAEGNALGYRRMVLDTLEQMDRARALYAKLGFRQTEPYYDNPLDGVHFMEVDL